MFKVLRFQAYTLHVDPTFWSTLYGLKLDVWKLDDSEKSCGAIVSNNSVYLDRTSLDISEEKKTEDVQQQSEEGKNRIRSLSGILRVFNTKNDLLKFYEEGKYTLLRSKYEFVFLIHADLKQYSFDYFFAWCTTFPFAQFYAKYESREQAQTSAFPYSIVKKPDCFVLPWVARTDIYKEYSKGVRMFRFGADSSNPPCSILVKCDNFNKVRYTGWSSATVTTVNLSQTMDPHLAMEQNADLNLKLMVWKHEPNLPLEQLRKLKCLLIGAGTVGCSVARLLIAWGMRDITFVDCAHVSPSNPVRQNLYTSTDVGKEKAITAAEALTTILPSVHAKGYTLDVPMPGHKNLGTPKDIEDLNLLIEKTDVIFLSTDSREGRWLPIALAKLHNKDIINIAINYASLLIQYIKEDNGCYFCTDPVAPGDTMSSRTIDEKCTITRPGVSFIASALAVEFYVDIVRGVAKHHQIRYNLSDMRFQCDVTHKNAICSCCSVEILSELSDKRDAFIEDVKIEPSMISDLSGYSDEYRDSMEYDIQSVSSASDGEEVEV